jgi:hypothetical protein
MFTGESNKEESGPGGLTENKMKNEHTEKGNKIIK